MRVVKLGYCNIIIMYRNKQKQEEKRSTLTEAQIVDKKINEWCLEIRDSRSKLDEYVGVISKQVGQIVSHRLNKFVALHSEIVEEKDHEIKALQEQNQHVKQSQTGSNLQKLMKTIANYEAEIQRINTIKEMFRKESEKFKIELDIKEKELNACKKREKQLMKQIWVLEEDIKDIYLAEPTSFKPASTAKQYTTPQRKTKNQNYSKREMLPSNRIISTEPTEIESKIKNPSRLEDKFTGYNAGLQFGATRLREKFSMSSQEKRFSSGLKSNTPSIHASNVKQSIVRPIAFSQQKQVDIYQDLRVNLRKVSRMKELQPELWNEEERTLKVEDFRTICLYGPKIMRQVEGVVIDKYGELREIDECSMELLQSLFKNENAIKILQIVLFSYSMEAVNQIQEHKRQLTNEIAYNQPSQESQEPVLAMTAQPKRVKMQKELRKKFKNSIIHKASDINPFRGGEQ